jgi:hypothetical protein
MAKSYEVLHLDRDQLRAGGRRPRKRRDFFGEGRRRIRFDSQAVAMMLAETRLWKLSPTPLLLGRRRGWRTSSSGPAVSRGSSRNGSGRRYLLARYPPMSSKL